MGVAVPSPVNSAIGAAPVVSDVPIVKPSVTTPKGVAVPLPSDHPAVSVAIDSFSGPMLGAEEKAVAMQAIRERALVCQKCPHLVRTRTQVVFGVGSLEAEVMFVGEAPGAEEDRQGEPFVGPAGQLLTRIIQAMGYTRETVYIGNILKCRPDTPGAKWGNRAPRPEEMETCKPYLFSQVEIIRPRVLVALGGTAVQGLLGLSTTLGAVRGRWHHFRGIPVMPTYHPSYLLRSEDAADKGFSEKRKTWEDMLKVLEKVERPITAKMRGYFLKPTPGGTGSNG